MTTRMQEFNLRQTTDGDRRRLLHEALDLSSEVKPSPPITAWKAWALAGWVLVAAGAYALAMLKSL